MHQETQSELLRYDVRQMLLEKVQKCVTDEKKKIKQDKVLGKCHWCCWDYSTKAEKKKSLSYYPLHCI